MRQVARILLTVAVLAFALAPAAVAHAGTPVAAPPAVAMASGILVDLDSGQVLWSHNDRAPRAPASLTKILTALVVLENVNLDKQATITPEARNVRGARIYAEAGWAFPVRELLWGLLLSSGNDAAIALAQAGSPDGTVEGFMNLANARAAQMGATSTRFFNPHGLDFPGHTTTARDVALVTMAAMRQPLFAEMVASPKHNLQWGDGRTHTFFNHNKLLHRYPGTMGVKTGFTRAAGHSLVSAVRRGDSSLVAVVLGSPDHYRESIALYEWGFANLAALRAQSGDVLRPRPPAGAEAASVQSAKADNALWGLPSPERLPLLALGLAVWAAVMILAKNLLLGRPRLSPPHPSQVLAPTWIQETAKYGNVPARRPTPARQGYLG
ncbi:MAG: D-alanyl-D-alanine carboxypeptidase [Actinomycetota bacterium]|nr:D-alanyl-D-alanine carboxypeptidase [Actinomycetota bacterium]